MQFGLILVLVVFAAIVTEAITEIINKASIFSWLQQWAEPRDSFLKKLLACPYCLSVWVAFAISLGFQIYYFWNPIITIGMCFLVHRLSNWLHHGYELLFWKALEMKERND